MLRLSASVIASIVVGSGVLGFPDLAQAQDATARQCGYYQVLGCFPDLRSAQARLDEVGGPNAGGGAGTSVIDTDAYPNFSDGWFCVADGPYDDRQTAARIAWTEFIPDSYVKSACR